MNRAKSQTRNLAVKPIIQKYADACSYPGVLDEQAIENALRSYLKALGVEREIRRLPAGWHIATEPSILKYTVQVVEDFAKRTGDALAARDARDARAAAQRGVALQRFAEWCIQAWRWGWSWYSDLSVLATTHIGAVELQKTEAQLWTKPVYDAFLAGCWMLHWTEDTLYWIAKPHVHLEEVPGGRRRLHSAETAALESDVERLYFWHGVLVPAFVVVRPDWITLEHIKSEDNVEVRRVMLERYGHERYMVDIGATREQADDYGELFRVKRADDSDLVMVRVVNSTPEPDGSSKRYMLRVPPTVTSARGAIAWTFGVTRPEEYAPLVES